MSESEKKDPSEDSSEKVEATPPPEKAEVAPTEKAQAATEKASAVLGMLGNLRKNNPTVFYGAIAAIVIILFFLMTSGSGTISTAPTVQASVGQSYEVRNPNGPGGRGDTKLVPVPGQIAAYEASDKDKEAPSCSIPAGSRATVLDKTSGYGIEGLYVKIRVEDGPCAGKEGWTTVTNLE